jgi:hypothetical protein
LPSPSGIRLDLVENARFPSQQVIRSSEGLNRARIVGLTPDARSRT